MATQGEGIGELIHDISSDVRTLAKDELELARGELSRTATTAAAEAGVILLGALVAMIGLGMLCTVVVVALAPVIPALWLRMLIMAVVYVAVGAGLVAAFQRRLRRNTAAGFRRIAT